MHTGGDIVQQMMLPEPQDNEAMMQNQNVLPVSLSITDSFGNITDSGVTAQLLQGLEGVQLQLSANLGQSIQITGLEQNSMLQTVQIDAGLLQQLQQQGNINLTINPNLISAPAMQAEPSLIQQAASISDTVNPNVVIQSFAGQSVMVPAADNGQIFPGQSVIAADNGQILDAVGIAAAHVTMDEPQVVGTLPMDGMMKSEGEEDLEDDESSEEEEEEEEEDEVPEGVSEDIHGGFDEGPLDVSALKPGEQQQAIQLLQQQTSHRMDLTDPDRTHICPVGQALCVYHRRHHYHH